MHCADPGCLKACPSPGAIIQYKNGIVDFHQENCIGCGYCISGCPFNVPRLTRDNKAYKCSLCSDRVAVGQEPACVKTCPDRGDSVRQQRGHERSRLRAHCRPEKPRLPKRRPVRPGRRGRHHVMYVLHHADKPGCTRQSAERPGHQHHGQPVEGLLKPLATLGIAAAGLFGFFHYITVGPNRPDEDHEATRILKRQDA